MRTRMIAVAAAAVLLCSSCAWLHDKVMAPVDIANIDPAAGVFVTMGDLPADSYTPVALLHASHYGLYLAWQLPLISTNLRKVLNERIIAEAKKRGADAVIQVRFSSDTFPDLPLSLVTLGTVVREVDIDAMAVRMKKPVTAAPLPAPSPSK